MKIFLAAIVLIFLAGCYPVHKTLQPAATLTVLDEDSNPIKDAEVTLISISHPYGLDRFRTRKKTDGSGKASFDSVKEWRIESMMLHGAEAYFWGWCVRKDGYETLQEGIGHSRKHSFSLEHEVALKKGIATPCRKSMPHPGGYTESHD